MLLKLISDLHLDTTSKSGSYLVLCLFLSVVTEVQSQVTLIIESLQCLAYCHSTIIVIFNVCFNF